MVLPTRNETALAMDNSELSIFISGVNVHDTDGPDFQGARTKSVSGADITNYGAAGVTVTTDVTVISGTPGIWATIQGKDTTSGKYYDLVSGGVLSTVKTDRIQLLPTFPSGGTMTSGNMRVVEALPRTWRVNVTHVSGTGFTAATYTVGSSPILRG